MSVRAPPVVPESPSSSAKKLRRWDSDDSAERKIRDKLGGFNKFEVENAVGKTTALNIKEYILQRYRNNREAKGNFTYSFWVTFFVEFDLISNRFTEMSSTDDSATEEVIGDACLTALAHAHDPNPALRRPDQFFSFLEYTSDCNLTELQLMLVSPRESPTISRKVALKTQVRILRFISKFKLHARWPSFWSRVARDFDRAFAAHVAGSAVSDAIRFSFVKGLRDAFEPFVSFRHFEIVEKGSCIQARGASGGDATHFGDECGCSLVQGGRG